MGGAEGIFLGRFASPSPHLNHPNLTIRNSDAPMRWSNRVTSPVDLLVRKGWDIFAGKLRGMRLAMVC